MDLYRYEFAYSIHVAISLDSHHHSRDFTINALAVQLNKADFGLLVDFFHGRRDIENKTVEVCLLTRHV